MGIYRRVLMIACCVCAAMAPRAALPEELYEGLPDDLSRILNVLRGEVSGDLAKRHATEIWQRDRWDSWDKHHETARYAAEQLRAIGLTQVEVIPYKSDGRTKYGDWTSPQAWDVHHARLTVVEPAAYAGEVIADYHEIPQTLTTRSGSSPPGGIQVELVAVRDDEQVENLNANDLRGKLILIETDSGNPPSQRVISLAEKAGAVGILRDDISELGGGAVRNRRIGYDAVRWGGAVPKGMIGFNLSPRKGDFLRTLAASSQRVVLHADVQTRAYDGTHDLVTGVLPGANSPECEILVVAHLYEIGANDNASGCALSIEVLRALKALTDSEQLPPLRRSIRVVLGMEVHGILAWLATHTEKFPFLMAGIDLDMVGEDQQLTLSSLKQSRLPDSAPAYPEHLAWSLIQRYLRKVDPQMSVTDALTDWYIDDCITADPLVGCPNFLWVQLPDRFYHSSQDTPDKLSSHTLHITGTTAGAYLYYLATAQTEAALWLAQTVESDVKADLADHAAALTQAVKVEPQDGRSLGKALHDGHQVLLYRLDRGLRTLPTVMELVPDDDAARVAMAIDAAAARLRTHAEHEISQFTSALETLASDRAIGAIVPYAHPELPSAVHARSLIPTRKIIGPLTLEDAPHPVPAGKNWNFAWSWKANTPWWWADGQRDVYEIARRSALETRQEFSEEYLSEILAQFEFFAKCGYVELLPRD